MDAAPPVAALPVAALRRFVSVDTSPRCHLCAQALPERHPHLLGDADDVVCACGPCHLLLRGGGQWRAVPDRVVDDPSWTAADVHALGLPVGLAIVQRDDLTFRVRYPGPAGVVEGAMDADEIHRLAQTSPLLGLLEPRVEALLIHVQGDVVRALLVPITAAFELVSRLRSAWSGFDGGPGAARVIDETFTELMRRSMPVR